MWLSDPKTLFLHCSLILHQLIHKINNVKQSSLILSNHIPKKLRQRFNKKERLYCVSNIILQTTKRFVLLFSEMSKILLSSEYAWSQSTVRILFSRSNIRLTYWQNLNLCRNNKIDDSLNSYPQDSILS